MANQYTEAFIEQALVKVYSRGNRTVKSIAEELNVNVHTVKYWMKRKESSSLSDLTLFHFSTFTLEMPQFHPVECYNC